MPNLSGVIGPSPTDERDYPAAAVLARVPRLPKSVRLDEEITIRDQGFWGTCVGKAGAELMSAKFKQKLSTLCLYVRCKQLDGIPHIQGTYGRTAMKVMQKDGVCLDKTMPYDLLKDHSRLPRLTEAIKVEAARYKIHAYARARNLNEVKEALANGHMLMGVMLLGDNFMNYRGGVVGPPTGELHGYHAIIICGYNDDIGAIGGRCANSWGTDNWGEDGFFWLSYDAVNASSFAEAWIVEVNLPTPDISDAEKFYPDRIFRELRRWEKK